ncbi:hypothetical protein VTK26DRAFT_7578 [Humicola hyalothermophila]
MKLPWLLSLFLSVVGTCDIIAYNGKEVNNHADTRLADTGLCSHDDLVVKRSLMAHGRHDEHVTMKEPAISAPDNETRHGSPPPSTPDMHSAPLVVTLPKSIPQLSSPRRGVKEEPSHATPSHSPPIAPSKPATSSSETGDETRNPAPGNGAIAGMSAGLVGIMLIFTVFL